MSSRHTLARLLVTNAISTYSASQGSPLSASTVPGSNISGLAVADLENLVGQYLYDCELRLQSPRTLETRRVFLRNWIWFLRQHRYGNCGVAEIRQFLHYLGHGHEEEDGRFGKANLKRAVRPITVMDYYVCLRSFFDWLVAQHLLDETPFATIAKPQVREESKAPLSTEQIALLFEAAVHSARPARNTAIIALCCSTQAAVRANSPPCAPKTSICPMAAAACWAKATNTAPSSSARPRRRF